MYSLMKIVLASAAVLILVASPSMAGATADEKAPAAAAAETGAEAQDSDSPCPAGGKCCGSAACGEARKRSMQEGKAEMADCPCKRNRQKPAHEH